MKYKLYIKLVGLFSALLLSVAFAQAQLTAKVGEMTTISISEVSGNTYVWELYDVSENVNFATMSGNCPKSKAYFIDNKNTGKSVVVKWLQAGEYFYKVTAQGSCANNVKVGRVIVVNAEIPPSPSIEIFYDCSAACARLKASGYTGSLLWSTGETSEMIKVKKGGAYTLVQIVNGVKSPPASVEVKDEISPRVNLIAKAQPPIIEEGGEAQLVADGCPENSTLVWYADEALTKELGSTTVSPEETTTYYAVCVNEIGCESSPEKVTVTVEPFDDSKCKKMYKSITIEQLISPNGDGLNDTWELQDVLKYCNECGKTARVKLFNRWGAKVYEKDGYMLDSERFDGYSSNKLDYQNSKMLPDGTYFYVIIVKGEKEKTGYINIVTNR